MNLDSEKNILKNSILAKNGVFHEMSLAKCRRLKLIFLYHQNKEMNNAITSCQLKITGLRFA